LVTKKTLSLKKHNEVKHLNSYGLLTNQDLVSSGERTQAVYTKRGLKFVTECDRSKNLVNPPIVFNRYTEGFDL